MLYLSQRANGQPSPWASPLLQRRYFLSSVSCVPPPLEMPLRDFSLGRLFQWLSISDVLTCFTARLLKKRVLFVSQSVLEIHVRHRNAEFIS
jgi:hypothetical protein